MNHIFLDSTKINISAVCLGCMLMGTAMDEKTSFAVLDHFRETGGNFLDTANCYAWWMGSGEYVGGESETVLGKWLHDRRCRDEVVLATKVGAQIKDLNSIRGAGGEPDWNNIAKEYEGLSAAVIRKDVENSLHRLQTDYIDLYYTHVYDASTPLEETLETLTALVKEGKVRHIGCSNIPTGQIYRAREISQRSGLRPYVAIQQEYSYLHPDASLDTGVTEHGDPAMLRCAQDFGMAFVAYSPLLKGIYGDKEKRKAYSNRRLYDTPENNRKLALIDLVSEKLGITGNQLVLAWLLRHQPQVIPILGFSKMEQYLENIAAVDIDLPVEILRMLNNPL